MVDTTYGPKVYRKQGGDELVVASGGQLTLEPGAIIDDNRLSGSTTVAADVLAIPVTHRFVDKTTGADAEALTLADGTFEGQLLTVCLVTDGGGDGTLTPTTKTGFVAVVFADAGDQVTFRWEGALGWMLVGAIGVAAPPAITIA